MNPIEYTPIGIVHTPLKTTKGNPIQPTAGTDVEATVEVFEEFREGLADLKDFSHIMLLFHCHRSGAFKLTVKPFLDNRFHGVFSTRAPSRPNAIGLSVVRLLGIEGRFLKIKEVDIVDGAPLLDIKPYVPDFDIREDARTGWMETRAKNASEVADDGRFS